MMLDRDDIVLDGQEVSDKSSGSQDGIVGEMPPGKSDGDMKPHGL